jgi:hypothetical protein
VARASGATRLADLRRLVTRFPSGEPFTGVIIHDTDIQHKPRLMARVQRDPRFPARRVTSRGGFQNEVVGGSEAGAILVVGLEQRYDQARLDGVPSV